MMTNFAANKRHQRYCEMRTMGSVQTERKKLRRMKSANEQHLREDMEDIQYFMTPSNLLSAALGRLAGSSPSMANVIAGVQTAVSLFRGRRNSCG